MKKIVSIKEHSKLRQLFLDLTKKSSECRSKIRQSESARTSKQSAMLRLPCAILSALLAISTLTVIFAVPIVYAAITALALGSVMWGIAFHFHVRRFLHAFMWIVGPYSAFLITEVLIKNITLIPFSVSLNALEALLNLSWYYIISFLVYLAVRRTALSAAIGTAFGYFWGNLNFYIYQFRGRIALPSDILSYKTAMTVQSNYSWWPSFGQIISLLLLVAYLAALKLTAPKQRKHRLKKHIVIPVCTLCGIYIAVFFGTPFLPNLGIEPKVWRTQGSGVMLSYMVNLRYSAVDEPEGYSTQAVKEIEKVISAETIAFEEPAATRHSAPNIIVIMNEAFSDLSVLGNLETNIEPMPFIRNLTENTVKGTAFSSVLGGNTANSEYEFLTGNSMAFFPVGSVPYQNYVQDGDYALPLQLNELGYKSIAMHPYYDVCWNRADNYVYYGFEDRFFLDDYFEPEFIRTYISDKSNYDNLIKIFEDNHVNITEDKPLFIFNVTMQNHGGYTASWEELNTVHLTGELEGLHPQADQYLSLIHESDKAFQSLVEYFETVDEPTIILMFGDHPPMMGDLFYETLFNKTIAEFTVEEQERIYSVPFIMWANYDIDEQSDIETSINFLSPMLLKQANLPMTAYQQFLSELNAVVPVVNSVGYREIGGEFVASPAELSDEARRFVEEYEIAQYNGAIDRENRKDSLFKLTVASFE